eukprot:5409610-Pleurochrysis_carterae.AAC.1
MKGKRLATKRDESQSNEERVRAWCSWQKRRTSEGDELLKLLVDQILEPGDRVLRESTRMDAETGQAQMTALTKPTRHCAPSFWTRYASVCLCAQGRTVQSGRVCVLTCSQAELRHAHQ